MRNFDEEDSDLDDDEGELSEQFNDEEYERLVSLAGNQIGGYEAPDTSEARKGRNRHLHD